MPRFWRACMLIAGLLVIAALIAHAGGGLIAGMLRQVGWGLLVLAGLRSGYVALRAGVLWRAMPAGTLPYRDLWWIRLSTEAVEVLTLTGPFLAEPAKGWLLKRRGLSTADAFGFVLLEYLLYTVVASWMAAGALSTLFLRGALPGVWRVPVMVMIGIDGAITLGFVCAVTSNTGLIAPIVRRVGNLLGGGRGTAAAARIESGERVIMDFLGGSFPRLAEALALEAAAHGLLALEFWVVFQALGLHPTILDALIFEGAVKFIDAAFFFVPGQLGAQEGLYSVVALALGYPAAAGLTLALARRIRGLIVAAAGLFSGLSLPQVEKGVG